MTHDQGVRLICGVISEIGGAAEHLQYTQAMGVLEEVAARRIDGQG